MTGTCGSTFGGRWVEAPRQPERTNAFRSELGRRLRPPPRPGRRRPGSAPRIELSPDVSATACNASLSGRCCDDSLNPSPLKGAAGAKSVESRRVGALAAPVGQQPQLLDAPGAGRVSRLEVVDDHQSEEHTSE